MTPMLRLTLEHFHLATDAEKPESYQREFERKEVLKSMVEVADQKILLTLLKDFLEPGNPVPAVGQQKSAEMPLGVDAAPSNRQPDMDINYWYRANGGKCPNCGTILRDLPPEANLYPHWSAACRKSLPQGKGE
jgi:hypothetical protein